MLRHEKTSFWQAYHKEAQEILKAGKVWLESDEAREMWGKSPDREDLYAFRNFQDSLLGAPTLIALDHYSGHYGECNPCDDATCGTQPACPTPPAFEGSGTQTGSLEEISIDTDADGRFYWWTKGDCLKDISAEKYLYLLGEGGEYVYNISLTFTDVQIPQYATVNFAKVDFTAWSGNSLSDSDLTVDIAAHCTDDGTAPTDVDNPLCCWTRTNNSTQWVIEPNTIATDDTVTTPDIAEVIHEIVNRDDWAQGNNITLLFDTVADSTADVTNQISLDDIDSNPSDGIHDGEGITPPKLSIWWQHQVINTDGGLVVGGSGEDSLVGNVIGSGGVVAGGQSLVQASLVASGGVVSGGTSPASTTFGLEGSGGIVCGGRTHAGGVSSVEGSGGVVISQPLFSNGFQYRTTITVPAAQVLSDLASFHVGAIVDVPVQELDSTFLVTDSEGNTKDYEVREFDGSTLWIYFRADLSSTTDNIFYIFSGGSQ